MIENKWGGGVIMIILGKVALCWRSGGGVILIVFETVSL